MMNFNYQKAYCTQAAPSFLSLSEHVRSAHAKLIPLVGHTTQGRDRAIPLNDDITAIFDKLTTLEIAELSRASYFVGYWHPSLLPRLFDSSKGEGWKITNCADQILRKRIALPRNVEIHEGKFRVTFSSRDCWTWQEFGLATPENLEVFKSCGLPFGETTLDKSATELAVKIGDLWPEPENEPENDLYREFIKLQKQANRRKIKADFEQKIAGLEASKVSAQKEIEFLLACNDRGVLVDNVIYYNHTDTFCFGWRNSLSNVEQENIAEKLGDLAGKYNIDYK